MTLTELKQQATLLEDQFETMSGAERKKLHPEVRRVVSSLKSYRAAIPPKLRQINRDLNNDAIEEMFDNLPV